MASPHESSPPVDPRKPWFVPYLDESKPWRSRSRFPLKPEDTAFAVREGKDSMVTYPTPEAFEEGLQGKSLLERQAAVPHYDRWFPAILLLEPREGESSHKLTEGLGALAICVILGWLYFAPPKQWPIAGMESRMLLLVILMMFGVMPLCGHVIRWWEDVRDRSPDRNKRRQAELVFFDHWLRSFPCLVLKGALALLGLLYLLQVFGGVPKGSLGQILTNVLAGGGGVRRSVFEAALVPSRVLQQGEWWRLVTAGVMHGSLLHILFNGSALYFLGRVTTAMVGTAFLGLTLLSSIVGGSLASLWLSGGRPSVGASGGVMGVLGLLTVILVLHRAGIPRPYKINLLQAILVMAIFGALGAQFIDNAAHAGGFLVGGLLGIVFVPRSERVWEHTPSQLITALGWGSWGVLLLAGAHVTRLLLQ